MKKITERMKEIEGVLISIKPYWCSLIASGEKTLEIRKTRPLIDTPFRCYVYCTKEGMPLEIVGADGEKKVVNGTVFGSFICNGIEEISVPYPAFRHEMDESVQKRSCVEYRDLHGYAGHRTVYGWRISDFELSRAKVPLTCKHYGMNSPPQSWGYVRREQWKSGK